MWLIAELVGDDVRRLTQSGIAEVGNVRKPLAEGDCFQATALHCAAFISLNTLMFCAPSSIIGLFRGKSMNDLARHDEFAHIMRRVFELAERLSKHDPNADGWVSIETENEIGVIGASLAISLGVDESKIDVF